MESTLTTHHSHCLAAHLVSLRASGVHLVRIWCASGVAARTLEEGGRHSTCISLNEPVAYRHMACPGDASCSLQPLLMPEGDRRDLAHLPPPACSQALQPLQLDGNLKLLPCAALQQGHMESHTRDTHQSHFLRLQTTTEPGYQHLLAGPCTAQNTSPATPPGMHSLQVLAETHRPHIDTTQAWNWEVC